MQLDKRDSGFQMLIAKLVVKRPRDAGSGDVVDDQANADCAEHDGAKGNRDNDFCCTRAAATWLRGGEVAAATSNETKLSDRHRGRARL